MTVATYNFTIEQGATYLQSFVWKDPNGVGIDMTGILARFELRTAYGGSILLKLDSDTVGGITIQDQGTSPGEFQIRVEADVTHTLEFVNGVYDLELVASGFPASVTRLLQGTVHLSPEVSIDD
jgi:hypothetical protein